MCRSKVVCGGKCCRPGEYCQFNLLGSNFCEKRCPDGVEKCIGVCCTPKETCGFFRLLLQVRIRVRRRRDVRQAEGGSRRRPVATTRSATCSTRWAKRQRPVAGAVAGERCSLALPFRARPPSTLHWWPLRRSTARAPPRCSRSETASATRPLGRRSLSHGLGRRSFRPTPSSTGAPPRRSTGCSSPRPRPTRYRRHGEGALARPRRPREEEQCGRQEPAPSLRDVRRSGVHCAQEDPTAANGRREGAEGRQVPGLGVRPGGHVFIAGVRYGGIPASLRAPMGKLGVGSADLKRLRAGVLDQSATAAVGPVLIAPLLDPAHARI